MSIDPAARRTLGRSAVAVSRLGLGAAPYGNLMAAAADADLAATTRAALGDGVVHFDTAPFYGHGLSEHRLGATLRDVPRDSYVLSTKVGRLLKPRRGGAGSDGPFTAPLPFDVVYDYSFDGTLRSLDDSLQRLGIARIDIALIHDVNRRWQGERVEERYREAMAGAFPALARLRSEGVIGAIGVGVNDVDILRRFAADGDFDCFMLAGRYTLLDTGALEFLLPECDAKGIGILLAAPYNSGILATGAKPGARFWYEEAPPAIMDRVARIEAVCARHGVALPAAALQFPLGHRAVASVVTGFRAPGEVAAAIAGLRAPIPAAFWHDLRQDGLIPAHAPLPP